MSNLVKISSITKKLVIALVGGFVLLFLAFHMCANLLVLRDDGGLWYSQFCHFMGTNIFVKIAEPILLLIILLHIVLTIIITLQNKKARPIGYKQPQRSRTDKGSKIMIWTGLLILCFLALHLSQFYMVKKDVTKGVYMVKADEVFTQEVSLLQSSAQYGMSPEEFVMANRTQLDQMGATLDPEMLKKYEEQVDAMERAIPVMGFIDRVTSRDDMLSRDGEWIHKINYDDYEMLKEALPDAEVEPDFYYQARNLFHNPLYVLIYVACFVVLWFHMRHAFPSAFQTLGLTNYTWYPIIRVLGIIYAWIICLGFAIVPLSVLCFHLG